jgi:uncharacterized membrane protein YccC
MPFGNVVLNGVAMAAVRLTASGIGAMLGNFAAVILGKSAEQKPPAFTLAMFLRSLLVGTVIALPLAFLNAPLWRSTSSPRSRWRHGSSGSCFSSRSKKERTGKRKRLRALDHGTPPEAWHRLAVCG